MTSHHYAWLPVWGYDYLMRTQRWLWRERVIQIGTGYVTYAGSARINE